MVWPRVADVFLKPHIRRAPSVLTETGKGLQAFPVDNREVDYDAWLGHPKVDGSTNTAFRVRFEGSVMGNAAAIGTKMKGDAGFVPRIGGSDIGARGTGKLGPVTLQVISPEHAIAAADGAVTGSGTIWRHIERPADSAAMTSALDHRISPCSHSSTRFMISLMFQGRPKYGNKQPNRKWDASVCCSLHSAASHSSISFTISPMSRSRSVRCAAIAEIFGRPG